MLEIVTMAKQDLFKLQRPHDLFGPIVLSNGQKTEMFQLRRLIC